nr:hypothetical protein POPTR_006G159300 [Ipomoea batatas]GMC77543.1 hypothetical protein POPTR_006G159300 [Ipomoea batatas]GMD23968.1 hypothetical protein POPTR_006G159300 [Ipomoea batatas]GME00651.1 hypothetical protein POPTR_006G159300 [Ipomoea batatas]
MCYPHPYWVRLHESGKGDRESPLPAEEAREETARARVVPGGARAVSNGAMKHCLCSPTNHPGSFRCRLHHKEYKWGCQLTAKHSR